MSERTPLQPGHHEALLPAGEIEKLLEAITERSPAELQAEALDQQKTMETARLVAASAERDDPLARLQASEAQAAQRAPAPPPNVFLQQQTLQRELKTIQRQESAPARALSRVVHQPIIRAVSGAIGMTISRPSGLLGGGVVAFLGSSVYLYLAYHIGFVYQPSVFLVLLVAGFIVGVAIESVIRVINRHKSS